VEGSILAAQSLRSRAARGEFAAAGCSGVQYCVRSTNSATGTRCSRTSASSLLVTPRAFRRSVHDRFATAPGRRLQGGQPERDRGVGCGSSFRVARREEVSASNAAPVARPRRVVPRARRTAVRFRSQNVRIGDTSSRQRARAPGDPPGAGERQARRTPPPARPRTPRCPPADQRATDRDDRTTNGPTT